MASSSLTKFFSNLFFFLLASLLVLTSTVSSYEFRVGGPRGWTKPTGDELEEYNHWATMNRFHIGDSLYFKYENDSVLVVDKKAYKDCNTTDPLLKFVDGNTTFTFDRHGYFYFISSEPGHCEAGERLIVRVMVHPEVVMPGAAPSPQPGSGGSRSISSSSSVVHSGAASRNAAASVFMAALGSFLAILQSV